MKLSFFSRLLITIVAVAFPLLMQPQASGQEVGQDWFSGATARSAGDVDAIYQSNSELPLGGLFAYRFTRTLTVLGGFNFPSDSVTEDLGSVLNGGLLPPGTIGPGREVDDTGYAISFAFGRRHSHTLRSEIEVAVRGNDINATDFAGESQEDGNITATSLMKNFIIDFSGQNRSRFTPYAGVGLGISYIDVEFGEATSFNGEPSVDFGQTLFSYQAIGGVATRINQTADFIVEYRFLGTSEVQLAGLEDGIAYNTSNLFLGVKFEY